MSANTMTDPNVRYDLRKGIGHMISIDTNYIYMLYIWYVYTNISIYTIYIYVYIREI